MGQLCPVGCGLPIASLELGPSLDSEVKREERRKTDRPHRAINAYTVHARILSPWDFFLFFFFWSLIYSKCIEEYVQVINKYIVNEIIECIFDNTILKSKINKHSTTLCLLKIKNSS